MFLLLKGKRYIFLYFMLVLFTEFWIRLYSLLLHSVPSQTFIVISSLLFLFFPHAVSRVLLLQLSCSDVSMAPVCKRVWMCARVCFQNLCRCAWGFLRSFKWEDMDFPSKQTSVCLMFWCLTLLMMLLCQTHATTININLVCKSLIYVFYPCLW